MKGGVNPVARGNVCPKLDPPSEPGFHAFSFTTAAPNAPASFVVSGSGESVEGKANYRDHTIRLGDISPEGMLEKAKWVLNEMERRMSAFRVALIQRACALGSLETPQLFNSVREVSRLLNSIARSGTPSLPEREDPSATMPTQEPERTAEAIRRALPALVKLGRYESRAAARRDRAVREIAKSSCKSDKQS
jgi:hypothetical protein